MADWVPLVLAAIAGVMITAMTGAKDVIRALCARWVERIQVSRMSAGLEGMAKYFAIVNGLSKLDFVDRVLLLVGHNGGGLPRAGEEYTVRSFYGYCSRRPTDKDAVSLYEQPLTVDQYYVEMLQTMLGPTRKVVNTTASMPLDAQLRSYYDSEGVVQTVIYFLKVANNNLYYLSVGSYSRPFTGVELVQIELAVQQLRSRSG